MYADLTSIQKNRVTDSECFMKVCQKQLEENEKQGGTWDQKVNYEEFWKRRTKTGK